MPPPLELLDDVEEDEEEDVEEEEDEEEDDDEPLELELELEDEVLLDDEPPPHVPVILHRGVEPSLSSSYPSSSPGVSS